MPNLLERVSRRFPFTRRHLFQLGGAAAAWSAGPSPASGAATDPRVQEAAARLEYLTPIERAIILDKGKAGVAKLPPERLREIGLAPETWSLEVVADPASTSVVEQPLSHALGNALDWAGLMKLAETRAIRFLHPCICTNGDDPYHVDLWEGVPLREVLWMVKPRANIRRVYYQSYHPENLSSFQASLPMGQVLETPPGQIPVVLAYKMNGRAIDAAHGGPVRMVVPGSYGSKSVKWIQRIVLTNDYQANDSDAAVFNNDVESPMKTKARFINPPLEIAAGKPTALTGLALVGISGLAKVEYCVHSQNDPWPADDPYRTRADWQGASILPPPEDWGGGAPPDELAHAALFHPATGLPLQWPMRFNIVHWAALLPGLVAGNYDLCCRSIDGNAIAQPMPRPLLRTGANAIHRVTLAVKAL